MSFSALREAINSSQKDNFAYGTVIRWTAVGRYRYAAIKTEIGWATTSQPGNTFIPKLVKFEELLEIVGRSETTDVSVSDTWLYPDGEKTDTADEYPTVEAQEVHVHAIPFSGGLKDLFDFFSPASPTPSVEDSLVHAFQHMAADGLDKARIVDAMNEVFGD